MGAAAWSPSLDTLLTTTPPRQVKPFDLAHHLNVVQRARGEGLYAQDRHHSRGVIYQAFLTASVLLSDARTIACSLEGELADLTARVAEAVRLLDLAESWATDENSAGFITEALAALRGPE